MEQVFRVILNISYTGGVVILAVLILRLLLKKAPKWISYALWAAVLFRLVCPFSFESALALIPSVEPVPPEFLTTQTPAVYTGIPVLNTAVNPVLADSMSPAPYASANPAQIALWIWGWVWALGIAAMLVYALCSTLRFYRRIRFATLLEPGVYESDRIGTAFVFGVFRPKIYVPSGLASKELSHVLLHERMHIKRLDHLWKPLSFLVLALHWFNPLVYLAYHCFSRDMELSCDERVLKNAGEDIRQAYSNTLLAVSISRGALLAPLAFGESNTKLRIKNVLQYKKPVFWMAAVGIALAATAAVLLLLNPLSPTLPVNTITETPITQAERKELSTLPEDADYRYSYHVDPSIKSVRLYVEGWREGVYYGTFGNVVLPVDRREGNFTISESVTYGGIYSSARNMSGLSWTVLRVPDETSGDLVTFYSKLPPDFVPTSSAASFLFYGEEDGTWPIAANEPILLGNVVFGEGDTLLSYDCQFLMESPEHIGKHEYICLFKCVFSTKDAAALQAEQAAVIRDPVEPEASPGSAVQNEVTTEAEPSPTAAVAEDAAITLIQGGKAVRAVSIKDNPDYQDLAQRVVWDHMIRSAASPAVDVESFEARIELYTSIAEGEPATTYYIFLQDGKPCMQAGETGMWTYMQEELYRELYAAASGEDAQ